MTILLGAPALGEILIAAMSQQNVEIAREVVEAVFHRRDFEGAAAHFDLRAEWHNSGAFPGPRSCSGIEEMQAFWRSFMEIFETGGTQVEDVADAGDIVVARVHSWGSAGGSGIPIDVRWAITFRFAAGKVLRADVRGDYDKALAAAGLGGTA
jgi:hypothetical protein